MNNVEEIIISNVFSEDSGNRYWFYRCWELVRPGEKLDSPLERLDAILRAVALKKILAEFYHRLTECGNDIGSLDVFSVMDELELEEEAVWFLAGLRSAEDNRYRQVFEEGSDIHDMIDFMVDRWCEKIAEYLLMNIGVDRLFVEMLCTAIQLEENSNLDFGSEEEYLDYVESGMDQLNLVCADYGEAYDWVADGMEI